MPCSCGKRSALKVLFAPKPELIVVSSGRGISLCEDAETPIEPGMAFWVRAGEMHQIINTGQEMLKPVTLFVPPFSADELYQSCLDAARKDSGNAKGRGSLLPVGMLTRGGRSKYEPVETGEA